MDFDQGRVLSISDDSGELLGGRSLDVASIFISLDLNFKLFLQIKASTGPLKLRERSISLAPGSATIFLDRALVKWAWAWGLSVPEV